MHAFILRPFRLSPASLALASALTLINSPALAAISEVKYTLVSDGTPGFDPAPGAGFDTSATNGLVRTHDQVLYRVSLSTSGSMSNGRLQLVLPRAADGSLIAEWSYIPKECSSASVLSTDRQTLDCRLSNTNASGTQAVEFAATILGSTPNGASLPAPSLTVSSTETPQIAPLGTPPSVAVSAAPFYDIVVQTSFQGMPMAYGFTAGNGPNGEDGFFHRPMVGLLARNPNGNGKKGVEQLRSNVSVTLDLSAYPASVRVDNFRGNYTNAGTFADGCGSPNPNKTQGVPHPLAGDHINVHQRVADYGPANAPASDRFAVRNGGDCTVASSNRNQVQIEISGIDTTLRQTPTQFYNGDGIPATDYWVSNKALVLWTDVNDYPPEKNVAHPIQLSSFSGTSISGQPMQNVRSDNDGTTYNLLRTTRGTASKLFVPETSVPAPYATTKDPAISGDSHVNFMAPNQVVKANLRYNNIGTTPHRNVQVCEILDRSYLDLGPNFGAQVGFTGSGALSSTLSYGVPTGSPYFASTDSAVSHLEAHGASPAGNSAYSQASCTDPNIRWFSTISAARAAGEIVYVRAQIPELPGGRMAYLNVGGLVLRETWAATVDVLAPVASTRRAGEPIEADTILRNRAQMYSDAFPAWSSTPYRDHLRVVPTRTTTRITKAAIEPAAITSNAPIPAGTIVTYRLSGRYSTEYPPMPGDLRITDILPAGTRYIAGSSTVGGQAIEPEIQPNTPGEGQTTLIWRMDDVTPHLGANTVSRAQLPVIEFQARMGLTLVDNTVVRNIVAISGGANDIDADCVYAPATQNFGTCAKAAEATLRIQTPPGFVLEKSATNPVVEAGEPFEFVLNFTPMGQELQAPNIPDKIDILPFVGDGIANPAMQFGAREPASRFLPGAARLVSVTPPARDTGVRVYYTLLDPRQIHNDPNHASNQLPGGSTRWCLESELGAAGCPATIGDSTAIRVSPGLSRLRANIPYEVVVRMQTDPMIARKDDIFANRVGARPAAAGTSLLFVESAANVHVRIGGNYSSLAGTVFSDIDDDGRMNGGDWGQSGRCVTLRGTTDRGYPIVYSTRTDAQGRYAFTEGATNTVHTGADCGGTPLAEFPGLLAGSYAVATEAQLPVHHGGRAVAGTAGGQSSGHETSGITLPRDGVVATGYDFTHVPVRPRLTLQGSITNDNGGTATLDELTLFATGNDAAAGQNLSGTSGSAAVSAVEVPVGSYTLSHQSLPGYTAGTWQCVLDAQQPAREGSTLQLGFGDEAVCSLVLDDRPTRLTLQKFVDNRNGRNGQPEQFKLLATGQDAGLPSIEGFTGDAAITGAEVRPGRYALSEINIEDYNPGPWHCAIDGRNPDTFMDGADITLALGDEAVCSVTNSDSPVRIDLSNIFTQLGDQPGEGTNDLNQDLTLYITPTQGDAQPIEVSLNDPATSGLMPGEEYELSLASRPGYTTSLKCFYIDRSDQTQRELPLRNNRFVLGAHNISCQASLKRLPSALMVSKEAEGGVRPVAGTLDEYEIAYRISVQHTGGASAIYDLVDVPAFDPDVQLLGHSVTRNGQPISVSPVDGRWSLASQQSLDIDATDTYRIDFRFRVPFGANEANNQCASGADNQGLFNRAQLHTREDLSTGGSPDANTSQSATACVDAPQPITSTALAIEKTSASRSAEVGDLISYRLRVRNTGEGPALSPVIVDRLPRGFRLEAGSLRVQGARLASVQHTGNRELRIQLDRIAAGTSDPSAASQAAANGTDNGSTAAGEVLISYRVRLGVGAQEGDGTNRAHVECPTPNGAATTRCSNESRWKVQVTAGIFSEEACLAGQIFVDCNGNSLKDAEELGIPGVRLYLQNGTWLVSDEHGKYSHCGLRPRTHVLKVDSRTLPRRARLVTSSAQNSGDAHSLFVDARKGMLHRADFIEGSCSATVIEQVKARQAQGANTSTQTEAGQPGLSFDSKQGAAAAPLREATDGARQARPFNRH